MTADASMNTKNEVTRRSFLKAATFGSAALAGPMILPGCVSVNRGVVTRRPRPSGKIHMAAIGIGWQGTNNLGSFLENQEVKVIAVCDLDSKHLERAKHIVDRTYDDYDCPAYSDFREMFEKEDIDAVSIAVPDHWHAILAIAAAERGYDIFGEKPFSHTLVEGRAMVNAVDRNGCIWQTGSWQRSVANFHEACELVRNGRIGKVHHIEVGVGRGHGVFDDSGNHKEFVPAPPELDYDMWLGPAAKVPYAPARIHKHWRWIMAHGGGTLMDWIGHHGDIAHWGVGLDSTGPVKIRGTGVVPIGDLWDAPTDYDCDLEYADGMTMSVAGKNRGGTKWFGDDGWIFVSRGDLEASEPGIIEETVGDDEIRLYRSRDHWGNFIDCIKSRKETITPAETAHRSASIGHLCNVAMYTGRTLHFNPKTERIGNDSGATDMLSPTYRKPWTLGQGQTARRRRWVGLT